MFLFGAWFCWLVVTLAWAPDPQAGLRYLFLLLGLGAVAVATASAGTSRRRLRYLLLGLAAVLGLSLLIATAEWTLRVHLPTAAAFYTHRRRPAAFFVNTNDFATYLALCWPFVLLLPALRRSAATILLAVAAPACQLSRLCCSRAPAPACWRSASRRSSLAVVLARARRPARPLRRGRARRRRPPRRAASCCSAAAAVQQHLQRSRSLAGQVRSGQGSGAVRFDLQVAGLRAAASRLFLGVGPGNAEIVVAAPEPDLHRPQPARLVAGGVRRRGPARTAALRYDLPVAARRRWCASRATRATRCLRYLGTATAIALVGFSVAIVGPSTAITFPPMAILFGLAARGPHAGPPRGPRAPGRPRADRRPPACADRPDLLDSRAHPDGVARPRAAARGPALSGGDAQPAGGGR